MNNTAQGIAALGRGPDSMLVHMAPHEVQSLQALAQAHGTSLTTNPDTGLPEALSLSSFLPMLAGAALMATGVGAPMAGMMVGGATALGTGSLQKGLMAGVGAYGGAGLAEGLAGAGTTAMANEALGSSALDAATGFGANAAANFGGAASDLAAQSTIPATMAEQGQLMGKGLSSLGTKTGLNAFTQSMGGLGGLAKTGLMATAPVLADTGVQTATPMPQRQGMIRPYEYTRTVKPDAFKPQPGSKERDYFDEKMVAKTPYKAIGSTFADGGDVTFAEGGSLFDIVRRNMASANEDGSGGDVYLDPIEMPGYNPDTGQIDPVTPAPAPFKAVNNFQRVQDYMASHGGERPTYENESVGGYTYDPKTQTFGLSSIIDKPYTAPGGSGDDQSGGADQGGGADAGADMGSGVQSDTGLQGQGDRGQTGLYGDAAAGTGQATSGGSPATGVGNPGEQAAGEAAAAAAAAAAADAATGFDADAAAGFGGSTTSSASDNSGSNSDGTSSGAGTDSGGDGWAHGGITALAQGGANLGGYSDGGRLLRGPGDGVSDSIPAQIGNRQPARLADGEFVVPARIVSELGNGSTEAGARQLYAMMDRIQNARRKSIGKDKVAANSRAAKHLPA